MAATIALIRVPFALPLSRLMKGTEISRMVVPRHQTLSRHSGLVKELSVSSVTDWIKARDESEKDGKIVDKVVSVYMTLTEFSPKP